MLGMDLLCGQQKTAGPGWPVLADPLGHSAAALGPGRRRGPSCTPYTWALFSLPEKSGNSHCCLCRSAGVKVPGTYLAQAPAGGPAQPAPPAAHLGGTLSDTPVPKCSGCSTLPGEAANAEKGQGPPRASL